MRWDLPELVEDAMAKYLTAQVNGELAVYSAWAFDTAQFPCAVANVESTGPISDPAAWHDARSLDLKVSVISEAVPETDDNGNEIITARNRNAKAVSKVLDALCVSDLTTHLNAQGIDGLAMDMAQVTSVDRSVDEANRRFVTVINIEAIAEPVTGSTFV
jgi:hypothetical protein